MVTPYVRAGESEAGMTVVELAIASGLLMIVVAMTTAALYSSQSAQEFSRRRSETLAELRLGAAAFSRDARQAQNAVISSAGTPSGCVVTPNTSCGHKITFDTFVAGSPVRLVEWEIREWPAGSGNVRLVRKTTTNQFRAYGQKLNASTVASGASYFQYTEVTSTDTGRKPTLTVQLNAKPLRQDPVIGLRSKVTFRND